MRSDATCPPFALEISAIINMINVEIGVEVDFSDYSYI